MVIEIKRYRYSPYGVDGMVIINGRTICATVEHPHNYLPAGCYPVTLSTDKALRRRMQNFINNNYYNLNYPRLSAASLWVGSTYRAW